MAFYSIRHGQHCATCLYWMGQRKLAGPHAPDQVEADQDERGDCEGELKGYGPQLSYSQCRGYQKWGVLKEPS